MQVTSIRLASFMHGKRIAIVGAGPAGLTLARLLQMRGADVHVYERDVAPDARDAGGSLDLHERSGQLALRDAGLEQEFLAIARLQGQRSKVLDKNGTLLLDMAAEDEDETRPEVDRGQLRQLLLDSLQAGTVHWNFAVTNATTVGEKQQLGFANGQTVLADLVVACDGTWSRLRELRCTQRPRYGGVTFVETRLHHPDDYHSALSALVGEGSLLALGDSKGLLAQRNGNGDIRVYVALRTTSVDEALALVDHFDLRQTRQQLLQHFEGWAPHLLDLLRFSEESFSARPLYTLQPEQHWMSFAGITLLGDAAHVMPPFTGQGANLAMIDALELTHHLSDDAFTNLDDAIASFERHMLARMGPAIVETLASQEMMMSPDSPGNLLAVIDKRLGEPRS